jgi:hypothetical protein
LHRTSDSTIGPYSGKLSPEYASPELLATLADLPDRIQAPESRVLHAGRNKTVCLPLPAPDGATVLVAVKAFARPSLLRARTYEWRGSKARRSWEVARQLVTAGVGTPSPIGFLERWQGPRLLESYFLTSFCEEAVNVLVELRRLLESPTGYSPAAKLIRSVAQAVRKLHAAGLQHNDLGCQNILARPTAEGWDALEFIDLNRARICQLLTTRQRACDVARLCIPHLLRPEFDAVYFDGCTPDMAFRVWEKINRLQRAVHTGTHSLRHPVKTWQLLRGNRQFT